MNKILRLLVTLAIASTNACAHGLSDSQIAKSQKRFDHVIAALVQKSDADSLAAAGLMSLGRHGDQSLPLLARAIDAAPDRPDIVWLQAQRCSQSPPCDPAPFERRLRELDPTNGAGWWGTLARASAANDAAGTDAALTAISQSGRLDIYWTTLVARLGRAVANTHRISLADSEVAVMGIVAATAIPAYQTYQIVKTPGAAVIRSELIHDARIVRMNATHSPAEITSWLGDSVGRWEGNTLIVETKYFSPSSAVRLTARFAFFVSPTTLVIERFTLVSDKELNYVFTVSDPAYYTRPWTGETHWLRSNANIYEFACHEGNYSMRDMLEAARAQDAKDHVP